MLKHCLNRKVIAALAVVAVAVFAVDPHLFGRIFPLLLFAICPLSMLLMMRAMSGNKASGGMGGMGGMSGCSSMSNGNGALAGTASGPQPDAEVARLRAELDQLRAERSSSRSTGPALGLPVAGGDHDDPAIS
ncbi:MAG: hypothetical protein M0Z42_07865 [Actinomycetota bacterium]|nr:hypothetical protein [Actinomycetota bacterium]